MNVLLTFDVEVWCSSWETLDADFPKSYERYVFGRSRWGEYALPKTLEILGHHQLKGVFFVEPLFAARFGTAYLARIIDLIQQAGHEVQLHLHPEWTDEARPPLIARSSEKRQHLSQYSLDEQRQLIAHGIRLLCEAGARSPIAFRSGSFACNEDTFEAVSTNGLLFDSSVNPQVPESRPGRVLDDRAGYCEPFALSQLSLVPMSSFLDGFGTPRHAQVGACAAGEIIEAMKGAMRDNWPVFVVLSHNFELLVPNKSSPDRLVVQRFERICQFLAKNRLELQTVGFCDMSPPPPPRGLKLPAISKMATMRRYMEQGLRRLL